MTHVFQREIGEQMPLAVKGEGIYIVDSNGKRYLDASCGAAVSCLGHSDPDIIQAIKDQLDHMAFAHSTFFSSAPAEELADFLIDSSPNGLEATYFVSGGSEGVEAALKMARQYFVEIDQPARTLFIARRQSYHGNTLGALSVGGNLWRRKPYESMLIKTSHISPCYAYRDQRDEETEEEYGSRVSKELEEKILELGSKNVAAFIAETVGGATAGVIPPVKSYFKKIRQICSKYGVLLILDEVMCGMGRTGTLFACEQDQISPDIMVIAKGLGAGYQPIGAVLVSKRIFKAFKNGSGIFLHGHTYMGHATACAAALAVQKKIKTLDLVRKVKMSGAKLFGDLKDAFGEHPYIGDIRGRGLFIGIELVSDRLTKKPFSSSLKINSQVRRVAMEYGLICYPGGGTVDGLNGDHILIAPPYIIEEKDFVEIINKLKKSVNEVLLRNDFPI